MTTHPCAQLELDHVSVSFGGFKAVTDLNLSLRQGELRCLIGPNGAGKTTTMDLICGKIRPTSGQIRLEGRVVSTLPEFGIARAGIARKFQIPSVFRDQTVRDNLVIGCVRNPGIAHNLMRFGAGKNAGRIEELAALVGLQDHLDVQAYQLSHGQTQWLEIALVLAQDPKVVLMDEPTAGMTAHETHKTAELFNRLRGQHSLIVVEHDMGFIRDIAETVSVLHQGQLLAEGPLQTIVEDERVREAYLGSGGLTHA